MSLRRVIASILFALVPVVLLAGCATTPSDAEVSAKAIHLPPGFSIKAVASE